MRNISFSSLLFVWADDAVYWALDGKMAAGSIETTSYALMYTVLIEDWHNSKKIASWLASKRQYAGGFFSTQVWFIPLLQKSLCIWNVFLLLKFISRKESYILQNGNTTLNLQITSPFTPSAFATTDNCKVYQIHIAFN